MAVSLNRSMGVAGEVPGQPAARGTRARLLSELETLKGGPRLRALALQRAAQLLPDFTLPRARVALLTAAGLRVGRGTALQGSLHFVGRPWDLSRISIGDGCIVGPNVSFGVDAPIDVGHRVALGPGVTLCTATHSLGFGSRRMHLGTDARPVKIGDGAWICMHALILPGVTVGEGAVVAAGSVVTEDVRAHTLVMGNPATFYQELPFSTR
jgi:maltose O-acetyltransferase